MRDRGDHRLSLRARTGDSAFALVLSRWPPKEEVADETDQGQGGWPRRPSRHRGGRHEGDGPGAARSRCTRRASRRTQAGLGELSAFLIDAGVRTVAMEATASTGVRSITPSKGSSTSCGSATLRTSRTCRGERRDLSDAEWLADVAAHGMVRPSFVPPPEIRELREITRYRKTQIDARAKEIQRLEKVLQDAGVKLTSVASTVWSASSRAMIEAMIAGERDPAVLAQMAKGACATRSTGSKWPSTGHFGAHHAVLVPPDHRPPRLLGRLHRDAQRRRSTRGSSLLSPRSPLCTSIPGISTTTAPRSSWPRPGPT